MLLLGGVIVRQRGQRPEGGLLWESEGGAKIGQILLVSIIVPVEQNHGSGLAHMGVNNKGRYTRGWPNRQLIRQPCPSMPKDPCVNRLRRPTTQPNNALDALGAQRPSWPRISLS